MVIKDKKPDKPATVEQLESAKHLRIDKDKAIKIVEEIKPVIQDSARAF